MKATITNKDGEPTLTLQVDFNQILDDNFAEVCKAIELKGFFLREMFKLINEKPNVVEGIVRILTNSDSSKDAEEGLCKESGISEKTANYILNMPLSKLTSLTQTNIKSELEKYMACVANIR